MADLKRMLLPVSAVTLSVLCGAAAAQQIPTSPAAEADQSIALPTVEVIAATPLLGWG